MSKETETQTQNQTKTKTETPKSDAYNAAAQNPFAAFDPMAMWTAFGNPMAAWTAAHTAFQNQMTAFHKMMADSFSKTQAWSDEYAANEAQLVSRAHGAVDTWAQLAHDTINYSAQLSAQARKLGFEAARKAGFAGA